MALFDEIGFTESLYRGVAKIHHSVVQQGNEPPIVAEMSPVHGRDYLYGLDRAQFDAALWEHLTRFPTVEARSGLRVVEVLRSPQGRVVGVEGEHPDGRKEKLYARLCVVGADGRHSPIARKVGAAIVEDRSQYTSTVHFAEWENVGPAAAGAEPAVHTVTAGRGKAVLFFPSSSGRINIASYVRSDRAHTDGDAQSYYLEVLSSFASVQQRLAGARQLRPLVGMRRIGNRYRQHGGPGWVLVGDALHHKDPVDTQGIYDALIESKRLAELLVAHHRQALPWDTLLASYQEAIRQETFEIFKRTTQAVKSLYYDVPAVVMRTVMRWLMRDPAYRRQTVEFLARASDSSRRHPAGVVLGAIGRGIKNDLIQHYLGE